MEISRVLRRLAVLLIVFWIRANAGRDIECNGRDFECEDTYNFLTCINLPDGQQLFIPNRCKPGTVCNNTNMPDEPCDSKSMAKLVKSTAATSTADPPTTLSERSTTPYLRPTTKPEVIASEANNIVPDDIEFVSFSFGLNKNNNSNSIKDSTANVTTSVNVEPPGVVKTSSKIVLNREDITNATTLISPPFKLSPMVETNTTIQKIPGRSASSQFVISTLTQAVFQSSGFMSQSIIAFNRASRSKDSSSVSVNVTTGFSDNKVDGDDVTFTTNTTVQFGASASNESSLPILEETSASKVSESSQLLEKVPAEIPCRCSETHVIPVESNPTEKNKEANSTNIPDDIRAENNLIETNGAGRISLKNLTENVNESQKDVVIVAKDLIYSDDNRGREPLVSKSNNVGTKEKIENPKIINDEEEASGDGILDTEIETATDMIQEQEILMASSSNPDSDMYLNSSDNTIASMLSEDNLIPAMSEIKSKTANETAVSKNGTVQITKSFNGAEVLQTVDIDDDESYRMSEKESKTDAPDKFLVDISTLNTSITKLTQEDQNIPTTELNNTNLSANEKSTYGQSPIDPSNLTIQFRNNVEIRPELHSEFLDSNNNEMEKLNDAIANEMTILPELEAQLEPVVASVSKENLPFPDNNNTIIYMTIPSVIHYSETRNDLAETIGFVSDNITESITKQNISSIKSVPTNKTNQVLNLTEHDAEVAVVNTDIQPKNHFDRNQNATRDSLNIAADKAELVNLSPKTIETGAQFLVESDFQSNFAAAETELIELPKYENKLEVISKDISSSHQRTETSGLNAEPVTEEIDFTTVLPKLDFITTSGAPNAIIGEENKIESITWMPDEEKSDLEPTTETQFNTDEQSVSTTQGSLPENTIVPFTQVVGENLQQQHQIGNIRYVDIDAHDVHEEKKENVQRPQRKAAETNSLATEAIALLPTLDEETTNEPLKYQRLNQHSSKNIELMTISPNWPDLDQLKPHPAVKETTLVNLPSDVPVIVESDIDLLATETPLEDTEAPITEETFIDESIPTKSSLIDSDIIESPLGGDGLVKSPLVEDQLPNLDSPGAVTISVSPTEVTIDHSTIGMDSESKGSDKTSSSLKNSQIGDNVETTETTVDDAEVKKRDIEKLGHKDSFQLPVIFETLVETQNETSVQIQRGNIVVNVTDSQNQNMLGNISIYSTKEEYNTAISAGEIDETSDHNQNASVDLKTNITTAQSTSLIHNKSESVMMNVTGNPIVEDSNQIQSKTSLILSEPSNPMNSSSSDIFSQTSAERTNKTLPRVNTSDSTTNSPDSFTDVVTPSSTAQTTTISRQNVDGRDAADFHGTYFPPEAPQIISIVSQGGARPRANGTKGLSSKPKGQFVCRTHGVYPDEDDCKQYFLCIGQNNGYVKITGMCPPRYAFSFEIQRCVRDVSSCYEEKCVKEGNFTDSLDDTSYFWCNEVTTGVFHKYHMECDTHMKFMPESSTCGIPAKLTSAVSSERNLTEVVQDTINHNATVNTNDSSVLIEPNYRLLSATTNTYEKPFIETFNSNITRQLNSTAASHKPQENEADLVRRSTRSVPDRNQTFFQCSRQGIYAHPTNCNQYYMCVKKLPNEIFHILRECPERYAYHADTRACSRDLSVCRNIFCRRMGNHPHPTEDTSYYRCIPNAGGGYRVYHIRCEPGKKFIPGLNSCSNDINQKPLATNSNLRVLPSTSVPTGGRKISKRSTVDPANDQETQSSGELNGLAVNEAYRREAEQRLHRILSQKRDEAARQYDAKMSGNQNLNDTQASENDMIIGSLERTNSISREGTFSIVCREEGRFADPTNCRKYFICSNRKNQGLTLHHLDCRGSDRFDATKRICVSEEDVRCA